MLKALFLDLDETLCDTTGANQQALAVMCNQAQTLCGPQLDSEHFGREYLRGIYREFSPDEAQRFLPIIETEGEGPFRLALIEYLLDQQGIKPLPDNAARQLQNSFDDTRTEVFDFYPGIKEWLLEARQLFTLVVITNGPEFSQQAKVEAVKLYNYVDHIIIGGQEPEQKPANSIFAKALTLAGCEAHEAVHVGDSLKADILGANNSGITSVWIQHQQPLDAELGIDPAHTVLSPDEVPALIASLQS